jgi:CubicO group peptidase (beta-lactamase class C family)
MKNRLFVSILIALGFIPGCNKNPMGLVSKKPLWAVSTPEAQGFKRNVLDSAFVQAGLKGFIDGLLVIRNGYVVAEKYYNSYDEFRPHNILSVSKSFLSAITGIAFKQGILVNLNDKVLNYFPEYATPDMDPRKFDITIRHLLTMRMGIRDESEDNYSVYWDFYHSDNWIQKTIESPLVFNPGERMRYNTFQTHLLSGIITKAAGISTMEFAADNFFKPMKIDIEYWEKDPQGYYFGGNSMYCTPREMALLGFLYLNRGQLNHQQIIPGEWIDLTLSPSTNFNHPNEWGALKNYDYAYLWWLGQMDGHSLFMGYGYGGQFIVVFPGLNLIVVSTANPLVDPDTSTMQEWAIFKIIETYILPSLMDL